MTHVNGLLRSLLNVETLNDFHDGEIIALFEVTHANIDYAMVTLGRHNEGIVSNKANGIDFGLSYVEGQYEFFFEGEQFETSGAEDIFPFAVGIDDPIFVCLNEAADKIVT